MTTGGTYQPPAGPAGDGNVEALAVDPQNPTSPRVWINTTTGDLKYFNGATTKIIDNTKTEELWNATSW